MGGRNLVHDCGVSRSIGYFLEPLIVLALFGKKPLSIRLNGITNDPKDPSVDTFLSTTFPILKRFGIPSEGLGLKIETRGAPPRGGGEVVLTIPAVQSLQAVNWIDEGLVKRIRGTTFSTKVAPYHETTIRHAARGIFNRLLPDVYISSDHKSGSRAGKSLGFGISLVAETTTGCFISADTAVSYEQSAGAGDIEDEGPNEQKHAEVVGEKIASLLLGEVQQGGVVDSTHQGLVFLLCALCPQDVSTIRVGKKLSSYGIEMLRNISDFLGVNFFQDPSSMSTETIILKCVGCGLKNLSRKIS